MKYQVYIRNGIIKIEKLEDEESVTVHRGYPVGESLPTANEANKLALSVASQSMLSVDVIWEVESSK